MLRNYIRKTNRGMWLKEDMETALDLCINEKKSCAEIKHVIYTQNSIP